MVSGSSSFLCATAVLLIALGSNALVVKHTPSNEDSPMYTVSDFTSKTGLFIRIEVMSYIRIN